MTANTGRSLISFSAKVVPPHLINDGDKKVNSFVEKVEKLKDGLQDDFLYRITFIGEAAPGFITTYEHNGKMTNVFYHYCEKNENKVSCSHLAIGAAIGQRLGITIEIGSIKTKPGFIESINIFKDEDYVVLNGAAPFNDLMINVTKEDSEDESDEEDTPAPTVTAPKATAPKLTAPKPPNIIKRNWKTGWSEKEDYLREQGATKREIIDIQQKCMSVHDSVQITASTSEPIKPDIPYIGPLIMRAIRHILNEKDLILIGDKGCGKDTLIGTISWIFGYPVTLFGGNGDENKESLVAEPAFKNNESTHVLSDFTKSIQNGDMVNFAEINFLPGDVTAVFHSLLDDNEAIPTKLGLIKRHPEHLIIGSMNVGQGYVGTKELNEALKDRFVMMRMPYGNFQAIVKAKSQYTNQAAIDFLEKIKKVIDKFIITTDGEGTSAKTLRGYIESAKYFKKFGYTHDTKVEAIEDNVINKVTNFEQLCAIREAIRESAWKEFPVSPEEEEYINAGGL